MKPLISAVVASVVVTTAGNVCLAATNAWPILLGAFGNAHGPFQVMADGMGGCACTYSLTTNNTESTVILWVDSLGKQIYKKQWEYVTDYGAYKGTNVVSLLSVDKKTLLYLLQQSQLDFWFLTVLQYNKKWSQEIGITGMVPAADRAAPVVTGLPVATDKNNCFFFHADDALEEGNCWLDRRAMSR